MKYVCIAIFVLAFVLLSACTQKEEKVAPKSFEAQGVVKVITESKSYVNIDHGDIPGYMGPMAMFFAVRDTMLLEGVAVNDSVHFVVEVHDIEPAIVQMDVVE